MLCQANQCHEKRHSHPCRSLRSEFLRRQPRCQQDYSQQRQHRLFLAKFHICTAFRIALIRSRPAVLAQQKPMIVR
jgi:hypothetical protein